MEWEIIRLQYSLQEFYSGKRRVCVGGWVYIMLASGNNNNNLLIWQNILQFRGLHTDKRARLPQEVRIPFFREPFGRVGCLFSCDFADCKNFAKKFVVVIVFCK
jgi:hypothetical protein